MQLNLVLLLLPPPHVAEQEDQDPHGPTSQSTKDKNTFDFSNFRCHLIPGGHSAALHVTVSVRGIVLADAHFVPLFVAPAILPLNSEIIINSHQSFDLFLFLLPPPHVTEQVVHDPHGPTSQLTKRGISRAYLVTIFLDIPEGQSTTLHVSVSASSSIQGEAGSAHFFPLFFASRNFALIKRS